MSSATMDLMGGIATPREASSRGRLSASRIAYRAVAAATLAFVVAAALLAVSHLMGLRYYVVVSGSMTPAMPTGSLCVTFEPYAYDKVQAGDIIAFRSESGDITTHRVSAITSRGLITKGDANEDDDAAPVTRMGYAGRVVWHATGLGTVVDMLVSPVGIGIVVAAVLALLVAEIALKRVADMEDAVAPHASAAVADDAADATVARVVREAVYAAMADYLGSLDAEAVPDRAGEAYGTGDVRA